MVVSVKIHTLIISEKGFRVKLVSPRGLLVDERDPQKKKAAITLHTEFRLSSQFSAAFECVICDVH